MKNSKLTRLFITLTMLLMLVLAMSVSASADVPEYSGGAGTTTTGNLDLSSTTQDDLTTGATQGWAWYYNADSTADTVSVDGVTYKGSVLVFNHMTLSAGDYAFITIPANTTIVLKSGSVNTIASTNGCSRFITSTGSYTITAKEGGNASFVFGGKNDTYSCAAYSGGTLTVKNIAIGFADNNIVSSAMGADTAINIENCTIAANPVRKFAESPKISFKDCSGIFADASGFSEKTIYATSNSNDAASPALGIDGCDFSFSSSGNQNDLFYVGGFAIINDSTINITNSPNTHCGLFGKLSITDSEINVSDCRSGIKTTGEVSITDSELHTANIKNYSFWFAYNGTTATSTISNSSIVCDVAVTSPDSGYTGGLCCSGPMEVSNHSLISIIGTAGAYGVNSPYGFLQTGALTVTASQIVVKQNSTGSPTVGPSAISAASLTMNSGYIQAENVTGATAFGIYVNNGAITLNGGKIYSYAPNVEDNFRACYATSGLKLSNGTLEYSNFTTSLSAGSNYSLQELASAISSKSNPVVLSMKCPHTPSAVSADAGTCQEIGHSAHYYCSDCYRFWTDSAKENETTKVAITNTSFAPHHYDNGTCTVCHKELYGITVTSTTDSGSANNTSKTFTSGYIATVSGDSLNTAASGKKNAILKSANLIDANGGRLSAATANLNLANDDTKSYMFIKTYLDTTAKSYKEVGALKFYRVDIESKYKTYISATENDANPTEVTNGGGTFDVGTTPVTVSVPLPDDFGLNAGDKVAIYHYKTANAEMPDYTYEGTVDAGGNSATFTTTHGFSEFELVKLVDANNAVSLTVDAKIGLNFYIDVEAYLGTSPSGTVYVTYNQNRDTYATNLTTTAITIAASQKQMGGDMNGKYLYTAYVAPDQMADNISLTLKDNSSNILFAKSYSVAEYCNYVCGDDTFSQELKNLCKAMLDYGSAAQTNFNYNTANPANGGSWKDGTVTSVQESDLSAYYFYVAEADYKGAALILYEGVELRLYYPKEKDVSAIINSATFKLEEETLDASRYGTRYDAQNQLNYLYIKDIAPLEFGKHIVITYYEDVQFYVSAYGFIKNNMNNEKVPATQKPLLQAMVKYGNAADAYFPE